MFRQLRRLQVTFDEGSGHAAALILEGAAALQSLDITLAESRDSWDHTYTQVLFAATGHLTGLTFLYVTMPVSAHLDAQALLDLGNLHRLRQLFVHSLRVNGDNGANASIHAEAWQLISLFVSCKALSKVYLDVELVISGEAPREVKKVNAIVEILDNGIWGASVIRSPPSSGAEALHQWSPASAESDIMLGVNSNFVPGGNGIKLNRFTELEE